MKTYAVRAATLLASVCLAASACGDSASPMGPDADGAPGISPTAVFSETASDSVPGKYLPTSGSEAPTDGGAELEAEPGKYLPTSGSEAPTDGGAEMGAGGETN